MVAWHWGKIWLKPSSVAAHPSFSPFGRCLRSSFGLRQVQSLETARKMSDWIYGNLLKRIIWQQIFPIWQNVVVFQWIKSLNPWFRYPAASGDLGNPSLFCRWILGTKLPKRHTSRWKMVENVERPSHYPTTETVLWKEAEIKRSSSLWWTGKIHHAM